MSETRQDPELFLFFTEIGIIEQLTRARLESVLPDNMKMSHFALLNHLVRLGGKWSPARLAAALQVTRAAITNTLNRLEARGLVEIETDPDDGRAKLVSLTAAGKSRRDACIDNIKPLLLELEEQFGREFFVDALPRLQELRSYLDQHR
jgi:DNA-binding MarR family transcriptional regulator